VVERGETRDGAEEPRREGEEAGRRDASTRGRAAGEEKRKGAVADETGGRQALRPGALGKISAAGRDVEPDGSGRQREMRENRRGFFGARLGIETIRAAVLPTALIEQALVFEQDDLLRRVPPAGRG
jgi:hypothetical protein